MSDFKCNECKEDIDINDFELFELYDKDEDLHDILCPHCNKLIHVKPIISFDFILCDKDGDELF